MNAPKRRSPSELTLQTYGKISEFMSGSPSPLKLGKTLAYLAKWRSVLLVNEQVKRMGTVVFSGPFQGMKYDLGATEGAHVARLLGCYESAIAPQIEEAISQNYERVLNIGCAEGYYAVGLARRMPTTQIIAFDSSPKAQKTCAQLAAANDVTDQIKIQNTATHESFRDCDQFRSLVLCDIEGGEDALLDPQKAPQLAHADILVEVHDKLVPDISQKLIARFEASHHVEPILRSVDMQALPDWTRTLSDLDRLLMLWEWRGGDNSWLWMKSRIYH